MTEFEYQGAKLKAMHTRTGYYAEEYVVTLDSGEWPSDDKLIDLLYDSGYKKARLRKAPFDGAVEPYLNGTKMVTVWQD